MKTLPLKTKLLAITLSIIVLLAASMTWQTSQGISQLSEQISASAEQNLSQAAVERVQASASAYGERMAGYINSIFRVPVTLAGVIAESPSTFYPMTREQVNRLVSDALKANSDVRSMYAQFEPDGYDDGDASYVGSGLIHSVDSTGSLEIYWVRNPDGSLSQERVEDSSEKYAASKNEFGIREAEWYLCSKDSKKACIMEPYLYEIRPGYSELMTSLVVPVVAEGRFRGVVGADLNLPILQEFAVNLKSALYNGNARVYIVSHQGFLVAYDDHYRSREFGDEHVG